MRYAKLKMPSWKTDVLKPIQAIPAAQIRVGLILVCILMGLVALLVAPICPNLLMPTGS